MTPVVFDAGRERLPDRVQPREGGQQRRVDVDDAVAEAGDEVLAQQLHVAGEGDEVRLAGLDPVAERVVAPGPVGELAEREDRRLDPHRPRPLQRPRFDLVGADPRHLDPLAPVQRVEDRLQVGPTAGSQHNQLENVSHKCIFTQAVRAAEIDHTRGGSKSDAPVVATYTRRYVTPRPA